MPRTRTSKPADRVSAIKHSDKRRNIPTEELRGFVADEEQAPKTLLYPRDPSLDPQLVWKGKDEQDAHDLAVPVVPIYIQEKIHPQAIIADLMAHAAARGGCVAEEEVAYQIELFADFNGGPVEFDQKVEFYQHEQNWANRMILGDSLLVMASLAEKEGLRGQVQMIYIDPPYGIKFGSNWQVSTRKRDVRDGRPEDATRQPEQIRAFRDTWKLGIHSYLSYLRDRLVVARELLTETGSIFVQIGDENVHLVRCLLDEVFGSENFISLIAYKKTSGATGRYLAGTHDFILWYARDASQTRYRPVYIPKSPDEALREGYKELPVGGRRAILAYGDLTSQRQGRPSGPGTAMYFPVAFGGRHYYPYGDRGWTTTREGMTRLILANRVHAQHTRLRYVRRLSDFPYEQVSDHWDLPGVTDRVYVVQTNTRVIERCVLMTTDPGDLVLDPTCGSGTTAYVAEQWGRRWITIDTSRVALALARTRLMAARYPYYLLADSPEGARKEAELTGRPPSSQPAGYDIRKGFVYKRVPHVTLRSIANNEEIDTIHARWQPELEAVRGQVNSILGQSWEEWEVPRQPGDDWPAEARAALEKWWDLRAARQAEIDVSIARHAETELLYDQPYEDNKIVRVSGPFTVESLSPHRVLAADEDMDGVVSNGEAQRAHDFAHMIIENLRAAGVQNTRQDERLRFDRLEPYPGAWLHAAGEYTDREGNTRRVAVSIGPEHGTVGPQQVKEAAKEAVQGIGFDLLIVCGFAFDPHVSEEVKRYGKLTVLPAKMNPDLAMGDELLKKTGAGNLFMVFGEPDVEIRTQKDGRLLVEIKGVDVYDPTTGQIRSSSTDDIACWFIDTEYDGESFFVRHAYFTGADQPYEKLKRALRAEIDEAAWSTLYSTVSRPFARPSTGKIAVKVINHYGDEVLKVYEV